MEGGKKGVKMESETVVVLREKAKKYKIKKWYAMKKAELIEALRTMYKDVGKKRSSSSKPKGTSKKP